MSSSIADGVLAATHKLVQQAMTGQWQDVPKTVAERRVLLDHLTASASPQDQSWLTALKSAMAESDAAVAKIVEGRGARGAGLGSENLDSVGLAPASSTAQGVSATLDMIRSSR